MVEQASHGKGSIPDRRCCPRLWAYVPVLVYGRTTGNEPFHESTEALRVNASGGLITLKTPVGPLQTILLINKTNQKEQKCRVVGFRGTYLSRSAIGFEFLEPAPDFWDVGGHDIGTFDSRKGKG
jgi:hypothetical protein